MRVYKCLCTNRYCLIVSAKREFGESGFGETGIRRNGNRRNGNSAKWDSANRESAKRDSANREDTAGNGRCTVFSEELLMLMFLLQFKICLLTSIFGAILNLKVLGKSGLY